MPHQSSGVNQDGGKNCVSPKIGNKTGMSAFISLIQHCTGILATATRQEEVKSTQIGKQEVKLSLFADDTILYIENPKDPTKKLLELMSGFSEGQDTK